MNIKRLILGLSAVLMMAALTLYSQLLGDHYRKSNQIQVFDCFYYQGQESLLQQRITALNNQVDQFVIFTSPTNQINLNNHFFEQFKSKITVVESDDMNNLVMVASNYLQKLSVISEKDLILLSSVENKINTRDILECLAQFSTQKGQYYKKELLKSKDQDQAAIFTNAKALLDFQKQRLGEVVTSKNTKKRHLFFVF